MQTRRLDHQVEGVFALFSQTCVDSEESENKDDHELNNSWSSPVHHLCREGEVTSNLPSSLHCRDSETRDERSDANLRRDMDERYHHDCLPSVSFPLKSAHDQLSPQLARAPCLVAGVTTFWLGS